MPHRHFGPLCLVNRTLRLLLRLEHILLDNSPPAARARDGRSINVLFLSHAPGRGGKDGLGWLSLRLSLDAPRAVGSCGWRRLCRRSRLCLGVGWGRRGRGGGDGPLAGGAAPAGAGSTRATTAPIRTVSPSLARIRSTPSAGAAISVLALSVSSSKTGSSVLTSAPSGLSH